MDQEKRFLWGGGQNKKGVTPFPVPSVTPLILTQNIIEYVKDLYPTVSSKTKCKTPISSLERFKI